MSRTNKATAIDIIGIMKGYKIDRQYGKTGNLIQQVTPSFYKNLSDYGFKQRF